MVACNFRAVVSSKTTMTLSGNSMRATRFISCLISGILLATPASLRAQPTNAPTQTPQPARRSLVPGAMNGGQAGGVAGFALGGPIGVLTDQQRASYQAIMNGQRAR